jgi:hypothetical protein
MSGVIIYIGQLCEDRKLYKRAKRDPNYQKIVERILYDILLVCHFDEPKAWKRTYSFPRDVDGTILLRLAQSGARKSKIPVSVA